MRRGLVLKGVSRSRQCKSLCRRTEYLQAFNVGFSHIHYVRMFWLNVGINFLPSSSDVCDYNGWFLEPSFGAREIVRREKLVAHVLQRYLEQTRTVVCMCN